MNVFQLLAAFAGGAALSVLGYSLARLTLKRGGKWYPLVSVVRQLFSVAYLAALFFAGRRPTMHLYSLLIGGALGLTVPSLLLTAKLLKMTKEIKETKETNGSHPDRRDDNG